MLSLEVKFEIWGRPSYLRRTLELWFKEVRDIVEEEYGIKLVFTVKNTSDEYPKIVFNGEVVFEGLPGEEGYLIELLKSVIERKVGLKPRCERIVD